MVVVLKEQLELRPSVALQKKVGLKLLTADNKSDLSAIALPPSAKALVEATLAGVDPAAVRVGMYVRHRCAPESRGVRSVPRPPLVLLDRAV